MNKLISFGDSFTWGSDLKDAMDSNLDDPHSLAVYKKYHDKNIKMGNWSEVDHEHKMTTWHAGYSRNTWPALLANDMNFEYICYAQAGCSNQSIVRQFFQYLPFITPSDVVVVNWTWIDRWDFFTDHINTSKQWVTVRATTNSNDNMYAEFYHKHMYFELSCKLDALKNIMLILSTLQNKGIKSIMTSVDTLILDSTFHTNSYINNLQNEVQRHIAWFDDCGFYNWAKSNKFKISDRGGHPTEQAHIEAFKYIKNNYEFT